LALPLGIFFQPPPLNIFNKKKGAETTSRKRVEIFPSKIVQKEVTSLQGQF
jgi:hypothetical protein